MRVASPPPRRFALAAGLALALTLPVAPVAAQERLVLSQGVAQTPLRPLSTADAARDWEAVGRLDTGISFCSATLIAPDLVLTAAHCLFDEDGRQVPEADLRFAASLRHGRAETYRGVRRILTLPGYAAARDPSGIEAISRDVALLVLDHPVPEAVVTPIRTGPAGRVRDPVTVVSYGAERERFASIEEDCRVLAHDGTIQILSCDVISGASGAPILRVGEAGTEVIAVMSAQADWQGDEVAVAVSVDLLLPDLLAMRDTAPGATARLPGGLVSRADSDGGRAGLGARFVRP